MSPTVTAFYGALLASDLPDPTSGEPRWWSSFAKAAQAGLATEIDLGPQADDIDVLYAVVNPRMRG